MQLLCTLLTLYLLAVFARIILSWFPLEPGGAMAGVYQFLFTITEPVLGPLRRVIPPVGGGSFRLDLSPLIVLIGIQIIQSAVLGC
ncbi:MAG: YggT family protein [Acidimicrobiales bacterium]|nr:YggT family protein [Acidimicrobiales bacterium]MCB9373620.1 YggT family protein [Microthrixaceae bacterium]